ncbi:unnamed protein product, partial [Ectocarpus sp. 12 AP-2014]
GGKHLRQIAQVFPAGGETGQRSCHHQFVPDTRRLCICALLCVRRMPSLLMIDGPEKMNTISGDFRQEIEDIWSGQI